MNRCLAIASRFLKRRIVTAAVVGVGLILSGCKEAPPTRLQGYIEGEYIYMAPPTAGMVQTLRVESGDRVTSGEVLFTMDATKELAVLNEVEMKLGQGRALLEDARMGKRPTEIDALQAQLKQSEAALTLATNIYERQKKLYSDKLIAAEDMDHARSDAQQKQQMVSQVRAELATAQQGQRTHQVDAAEANVRALTAAVAQARWSAEQTTQTAPQNALVFDTYFRPGEFAAQGRPIVSLLPPERTKALTFVPETKLAAMSIGSSATITMDGTPTSAVGRVTFISPQAEFTPPVIYSRDMRQKLSYRIEISFPPEVAAQLHPGQPVDVQIEGVTP